MNAVSRAAGAWMPTTTATEPITAASEYAGAVEARPIESPSMNPIPLALRPSSSSTGADRSGSCSARHSRALPSEDRGFYVSRARM